MKLYKEIKKDIGLIILFALLFILVKNQFDFGLAAIIKIATDAKIIKFFFILYDVSIFILILSFINSGITDYK